MCAMQLPDRRARYDESPLTDAVRVEQRAELFGHAMADQDGRYPRARGDIDANGMVLNVSGHVGLSCL